MSIPAWSDGSLASVSRRAPPSFLSDSPPLDDLRSPEVARLCRGLQCESLLGHDQVIGLVDDVESDGALIEPTGQLVEGQLVEAAGVLVVTFDAAGVATLQLYHDSLAILEQTLTG